MHSLLIGATFGEGGNIAAPAGGVATGLPAAAFDLTRLPASKWLKFLVCRVF